MKLLNNGSLFKEKPRNATVILVQLGAPQSPNHHSFQTWPKEAERDDEDFVAEAIQGDPRRETAGGGRWRGMDMQDDVI